MTHSFRQIDIENRDSHNLEVIQKNENTVHMVHHLQLICPSQDNLDNAQRQLV